MRTAEAATMN